MNKTYYRKVLTDTLVWLGRTLQDSIKARLPSDPTDLTNN